MKLGPLEITRALSTPPKKGLTEELGATGTQIAYGFISGEEYLSELVGSTGLDKYDKMRKSDAQVTATLLALELPIRRANWFVSPASKDPKDEEVQEFVSQCLFEHLETSWDDFLHHVMLGPAFGFTLFEKVFKILDDKWVWKKFAPRLPKTVLQAGSPWKMENGELVSVTQYLYGTSSSQPTIEIPVWKLLLFPFNKEGDNWEGRSCLRPAYKAWYFKDKIEKFRAIRAERQGVGVPVFIKQGSLDDKDRATAKEMAQNLRAHENAYILLPDGWKFEFADMHAPGTADTDEDLHYWNRQITQAILASFLELGARKVGTEALAKEQTTLFSFVLEAVARWIKDTINTQAIPQLVDLNYNVDRYPKLDVNRIGKTQIAEIAEAMKQLADAGFLVPDENIEQFIRNELDLPEAIVEDKEKTAKKKKPKEEKPEEEEGEDEKKRGGPGQELSLKETKWHRDLTRWEKKVKLAEIEERLDTAEEELEERLREVLQRQREALLADYERVLETGSYNAISDIDLKYQNQYEQALREEMEDLYEFGIDQAAEELDVDPPAISRETRQEIKVRASALKDLHIRELLFGARMLGIMGKGNPAQTTQETLYQIGQRFDQYVDEKIPLTAAEVVANSLNMGRRYVFDQFQEDIYAFQYSAVLDDVTCFYCMSLDGRIVAVGDPDFYRYHPEQHYNCRCLTDPKVPIYTSKGKKPIKDIRVGDLVLTHKGRFRKVTRLLHTEKQKPTIVKFWLGSKHSDQTLSVTDYHPILVNGEWRPAISVNEGDKLTVLAKRCKYTGELIPTWRKTFSRSISSKVTAERQWTDEKHRENVSQKCRDSILEQYKNGNRDPMAITAAAHEKTRELVRKGNHPFQDPQVRIKAKRASAKRNYGTNWLEEKIGWLLDQMGIKAVAQHPILNGNFDSRGKPMYYFADYALIKEKIIIECDGNYWHNEERDRIRDEALTKQGWTVIHLAEDDIHNNLDNCRLEIENVFANHAGQFEFIEVEVARRKVWKRAYRPTKLWNFEVDEDNSYIAGKPGVVVHNCIWVSIKKDEENLPEITGIPDEIPAYPDVSSFKQLDRIYIAPGNEEMAKRIRQEIAQRQKKIEEYEKEDKYPNRIEQHQKTIDNLQGGLQAKEEEKRRGNFLAKLLELKHALTESI